MSAQDLSEYRVPASPDTLEEDVVLAYGPIFLIAWSFMAGMYGTLAILAVYSLVQLLSGTWNTLPRDSFWIGIVAISALSFAVLHLKLGKKTMTVNRHGIVVVQRGRVLQSCPWEEMTVVRTGRGLRASENLADQYGSTFPSLFPLGNHPDEKLAWSVIRTKTRDLVTQLTPRPTFSDSGRLLVGLGMIGLGIPGFVLIPSAQERLIAAVTLGDAGMQNRAIAMLQLVGVGLLACCLILGVIFAGTSVQEALQRREIDKAPKLKAFIAERQGKLDAAMMPDGVWHRYVAPEELRKREQNLPNGILVIGLWLCLGALCLVKVSQDPVPPSTNQGAILIALHFAVIGLVGWIPILGLRLRRCLPCEVRRVSDRFEVRTPDGMVDVCRIVRAPKRSRSSSQTFGSLSIKLVGRRTYLFDPRYLVPCDDCPNQPLQILANPNKP